MAYGVFLGYRLTAGERWKGKYLVADLLSDLANKLRGATESAKALGLFDP